MDLKKGTVTVGEILSNPTARQWLELTWPDALSHPLAPMVEGWTINRAAAYARGQGVPPKIIGAVLKRLEQL